MIPHRSLFERIAEFIGGAPLTYDTKQEFAVQKATSADKAIVSVETSYYGTKRGGGQLRFNPDDLVGKKGLGIYKKMLIDEQVKAVCTFKRDAILSRGWSLEYEDTSPLSEDERKARIDLLTKLIDRTPGSFIDTLNAVSRGREYGFSLVEKVYDNIEIEGKTWTGLRKFVARDPMTFEFHTDPFGELVKCIQNAGGQQIEIDLDKFIYYVHNPEFDPYFGQSDLRSAYRSWYVKNEIINMWATFLERFGAGFLMAQATGDQAPRPGTPAYTAMQTAMVNARNGAAVIGAPGMTLSVEYPATTDAYEKACTWHDLAIAKALLVPNLLGVSHTGQTGSYSQSNTQLESFAWTVTADKHRLEACLNDQLIKDLGERNWGDGEYPKFVFNPVSEEHKRWLIDTFSKLLQVGAVIATEEDETRLRQLLDMPPRAPDSEPLINPLEEKKLQQQADQAAMNAEALAKQSKAPVGQGDKSQFSYDEEKHPRDENGRWTTGGASGDTQVDGLHVKTAGEPRLRAALKNLDHDYNQAVKDYLKAHPGDDEDGAVSAALSGRDRSSVGQRLAQVAKARGDILATLAQRKADGRAATAALRKKRMGDETTSHAFTRAVERVNFAVIDRRQTMLSTNLTSDLATQVARATLRMLGTPEQLAKLVDDDPTDIAAVELNGVEKGKLKALCQRALNSSWLVGQQMAMEELRRVGAAKLQRVSMADIRDKASQYFEANGFRMAGNLSDAVRAMIQQELQNSVKFGRTPAETRKVIWARLQAKGFSTKEAIKEVETDESLIAALDALWTDTEEESASYLDTLSRTNLFEAMNEARYAEFTDPALDGFVVALRYSAVLDERTTQICAALHDRVYLANNPVWDDVRPPNHFNCRSLLIPITQVDIDDNEWNGVESLPPPVEPQAGFGKEISA